MVLATPALTAPWGLDALLTLTDAGRAAAEHAAAISPERLLQALLSPPDGAARRLLGALSVDVDTLIAPIAAAAGIPTTPDEPGRFDYAARALLGSAAAEARAMGADRVEDLHLLLGLLCGPSGPARFALEQVGVTVVRARSAARDIVRNPAETSRRRRDAGLSLDEVRSEAARLMGDASPKRKLVVIDEAAPARTRRAGWPTQRPLANSWSSSRQSARVGALLAATRPSPVFLGILGVVGASAILLAWNPAPQYQPLLIALFIIASWFVSLCVHEYGHAAAAFLGGDRETHLRGYLTLDVRRYANPMLTFALPLVGLLLGGLPLPGGAVLINRHALRSQRWELAVSAAGPLGTLICLLVSATPFLIGGPWVFYDTHHVLWIAIAGSVAVQASSLVLNLLPIPPLDGFHILSHWFSPQARAQGFALGWIPLMILFFVLRQPSPVGDAFWGAVGHIELALRLPAGLGDYAVAMITAR